MIPGGSWVEIRWPRGDTAADVQEKSKGKKDVMGARLYIKRWENTDLA